MQISQELTKGTVEPIILKLLSERAMYGYQIIKVVNERTANAFQWKEGTLYPWLHRLEGDGLIRGEWTAADNERQRKYYRITRSGRALLAAKVSEWQSFASAVNAVLCAPAPA